MANRPRIKDTHIWIEIDLTPENTSRITEWSLLSTPIVEQLIEENPNSIFVVYMNGSVGIRKKNTAYNRTH